VFFLSLFFPKLFFSLEPVTTAALLGLAGTGLSVGGSLIGAGQSARAQRETNDMNLAIAREQMAFQRTAMQNRHQWEVADLRAAGLNPILSAGGQPPVPSGATANMLNPKPNRGELFLNMASAIQDVLLKKELRETEKTKQAVNLATADRGRGTISIPGVYSGPVSTSKQWLSSKSSDIKGAFKAVTNLLTRGTFADK
jgi:hypothetical protein